MKNILQIELKRIIITLLTLFCCIFSIESQDSTLQIPTGNINSISGDDELSELALPPIEIFFENAQKGPVVQLFDLKIKNQKAILQKEKRAWSGFFSIGSGYNWGNVGVYSSYSDLSTPIFSAYSGTTQTSFQVGGNFGFSLESLLDLAPRVKRQKIIVEMAEKEREQALDELRSKVVDMYLDAKLQISLLKLQAQSLAYANAMFKMVEQDFFNGQKDQLDLSKAKSEQSKALEIYEKSKTSLISALLKLEITTRTPIIHNNK